MSKTISCPNCGAKYKVPEDTKASRAKCKACGTVIDIQSQLHAAPTAPRPSKKNASAPPTPPRVEPEAKQAEKDVELPVSARKKNPSREGIRRAASKPGRSSRASRSARGRDKGGAEETGSKRGARSRGEGRASGRRGRNAGGRSTAGRRGRGAREENAPEEKSKTPMYLGIGGGVIAIAIAAFFLFKSPPQKAKPKQDQNKVASNDQKPKNEGSKSAKAGTNPAANQEKVPANAVASKAEGSKPSEASSPKKKAKKAAKKPVTKKKRKKFVYGESSTPFDAKSLDPVPFTDDTTEEEKADLKRWTKKMLEDTGFPGTKARNKIIKMGRKGVPALINALRGLDYTTKEGTLTAQLLNEGLSQIFMGLNAGFNIVQGKPKDEVAWWNAKCVRTWIRQWEAKGSGDPEQWDAFIRARKKKMK